MKSFLIIGTLLLSFSSFAAPLKGKIVLNGKSQNVVLKAAMTGPDSVNPSLTVGKKTYPLYDIGQNSITGENVAIMLNPEDFKETIKDLKLKGTNCTAQSTHLILIENEQEALVGNCTTLK